MEILRKNVDLNIILNKETDFQTNAGWQENLVAFEDEILSTILNPIENYETIRYIHKPYTLNNINQTDIWFYFYFATSGNTPNYVQDYSVQGITLLENEKMMKQSSESFFRLEFFKTPGILDVNGNTIGYQPPTRQNRKLVFAKNLSLPLGEKYYYTPLGGYIHLPVFKGSNYENKENMYFFWFQDESVLKETNLSGTTTGNTFFMTAKFFNAKDGSIQDFTNDCFSTGYTLNEQNDMYYQVDIDKTDYSYKVYYFNGVVKCDQVGFTNKPISFFEKGGGSCPNGLTYYTCSNVTPTPTLTSTPAATPAATPASTPASTPAASPAATPAASPASNSLTFTATVDKEYIGEQPPGNVITVTVTTNMSAVGMHIWWGKKSGTANVEDFENLNTATTISSPTGYTFDLTAVDDESENEGEQTFSVAIFTGSTSVRGGEVAFTDEFRILDDSIKPPNKYALLERVRNYEGCPDNSDVTGDQNYYWNQFTNGSLDGSLYIYTGLYCYRYVSGFDDENITGGKSEISTNDLRSSCPSCPN